MIFPNLKADSNDNLYVKWGEMSEDFPPEDDQEFKKGAECAVHILLGTKGLKPQKSDVYRILKHII